MPYFEILNPETVNNHKNSQRNPWKIAALTLTFVLGFSIATMMNRPSAPAGGHKAKHFQERTQEQKEQLSIIMLLKINKLGLLKSVPFSPHVESELFKKHNIDAKYSKIPSKFLDKEKYKTFQKYISHEFPTRYINDDFNKFAFVHSFCPQYLKQPDNPDCKMTGDDVLKFLVYYTDEHKKQYLNKRKFIRPKE